MIRFLLAVGLLVSCVGFAGADDTQAPEALTVNVETAVKMSWPTRIQAAGSIRPWQEALVASETAGLKVVAILADVGDRVKRGQVLVRLASSTTEAAIAEQEARLAQAEASLEEARSDAHRSRTVQGTGALSAQQAEQYRLREKAAEANQSAAIANLKGLRVKLSQTQVVAPDDGIITERKVILGQVVQVGTDLFRMNRQARIEWFTEVTLEQFPRVKPGQTAMILLPEGKPVVGQVRVVYPQLTIGALVGNVLVSIPEDPRLMPGYLAYGFIDGGPREVLTIPQTAVSWRDGKSYVFVCDTDNRVSQRRVTLGQTQDDRVEVTEGMAEGDTIVAAGAAYLSEGDRVRRADPTATPVSTR